MFGSEREQNNISHHFNTSSRQKVGRRVLLPVAPSHPQFVSPRERVKEVLASLPADPRMTPEEASRAARMPESLHGSGCPAR